MRRDLPSKLYYRATGIADDGMSPGASARGR